MAIHNHPSAFGLSIHTLPSVLDLKLALSAAPVVGGQIRSHAIAVQNEGQLAGYTVFNFTQKKETPKKNLLAADETTKSERDWLKEYSNLLSNWNKQPFDSKRNFRRALELLKAMGVKIKFTPNKKEGYQFTGHSFAKA